MSQPYRPINPQMRLSDDERSDAMSALGRALAEGRITLPEYESRIEAVCNANNRGELAPLFRDIPHQPGVGSGVELYSANEIAETHQRGRKTRAGLLGLVSVGSIAGMIITTAATGSGAGVAFLLLIPTVFILLYVMKVGPSKWYVPSPRQLERQRMREIRAAHAHETAQRRIERKQQFDQLTGEAMGLAQNALDRFKDKGNRQ
ncbi:DUF1707 SHOCT-like domain-containing protein [Corynebacterium cystitidis]|uniref:DUF1707 SHOCT-like domain-containing protein n=1 Tax=Corynebacterium cystitidis TaxID=35757 RepID=UPI00211F3485|nr:DUF1707 domain-containing protein [Corynebacterium cystitidis]